MSDPDATTEIAGPAPTFLHPASGGLILGLDWLLFSGTAASGGLAMPLSVTLGFLFGTMGTAACQRFIAKERWRKALGKGLLAGVVVGVPFPIGGTVLGGAVLASSGLHHYRERAARALLERSRGRHGES